MCISHQQFDNFSLCMNIIKYQKSLDNLQNSTDVLSRYGCNGNTHVHHVDPMYVHKFTCIFIDRIFINFMDINSISYQASCGRVVITVGL